MVTAWIQDYSDAIGVAYSNDGDTWTTVLPQTTSCTGERGLPYNSALDPWLSFGASLEGSSTATGSTSVLYLSSILSSTSGGGFAAVVNRSLDGGMTWSPPTVLDSVPGSGPPFDHSGPPFADYLDGSRVVADETHPGRAYAVWGKGNGSLTDRAQYLSRTLDGGVTWSAPTRMMARLQPMGGTLLVLGDGSLVDVFTDTVPQAGALLSSTNGPSRVMATRSSDLGVSWSEPMQIAIADETRLAGARAALGPDGTVYVAWQRSEGQGIGYKLMFSKSTDGGSSWEVPRVIASELGAPFSSSNGTLAAPSLEVARDGIVGMVFYDHRDDPPGTSPPEVTDLWFLSSRDEGASWGEIHLAGPFDQTKAPFGALGDSQGIAPRGNGFATTFTLANELAAQPPNPTDIFYSRISVKPHAPHMGPEVFVPSPT